ncbi:unnamed protein product [Clonostachys rhizophaga]|uniref:Transcription factor domain-containing protein n=1 Tax=Clonostachys rhizophaga TaxID=160324 RepID=A0A9N9VIC7_9HYPO|nr:unnamed protein product [Clonostachys rhizophaga]
MQYWKSQGQQLHTASETSPTSTHGHHSLSNSISRYGPGPDGADSTTAESRSLGSTTGAPTANAGIFQSQPNTNFNVSETAQGQAYTYAGPGPIINEPMQPSWDMSLWDDFDLLRDDVEPWSSGSMLPSLITDYRLYYAPPFRMDLPELNTAYPSNVEGTDLDYAHQNDNNNKNMGYNAPAHLLTQHEDGVISRYESRLPSMQPGEGDASPPREDAAHIGLQEKTGQSPFTDAQFNPCGKPWRISKEGYRFIQTLIQSYTKVLPDDFVFPTRHSLWRYVEGFFSGFHEHLPFIHLPTFSMVTSAPELILAIASMGARYRFQRKPAYDLYLAARALLEHQLSDQEADSSLTESASDFLTDGNFPSSSYSSIRGDDVGSEHGSARTARETFHDKLANRDRNVQTMEAMIILIAMGTWNHKHLIRDALSTASQLALMVREDYQLLAEPEARAEEWLEWVAGEGRRRTILVAMSFLNLHSIAYDIPPKLPQSELGKMYLPAPETWWRAEDASAWEFARRKDAYEEVTLHASYASLIAPEGPLLKCAPSSFGNYILIHCIMQQIFFSRQLALQSLVTGGQALSPEVVSQIDLALRRWQRSWEATKDSSLDPSSKGGPLSFNSTALFRLAYIRLSANMGPCRRLDSGDPVSIAVGFRDAPFPERSSCVGQAVLQSAHSLSIPVRIGIEFVARTQALTWSIVHSLCGLECGLFLAKWLEKMALVSECGEALRDDERRLLGIVDSIISESDLGPGLQREHCETRRIRLMAVSVLRLWGHMLQGAHVFDIMSTIGAGLTLSASMMHKDMENSGSKN